MPLTKETALERIQTMLDAEASRSKVCSLINDLEHAKLIGHAEANTLAGVLAGDRSNNRPVLRMLQRSLQS